MVLRIASLILLSNMLSGFTLISGPEAATLPVDPSQPAITFGLHPDMPKIKNKAEYKNGTYADLSDEEFWLMLVNMAMQPWNDVEGAYVEMNAEIDANARLDSEDRLFSIVTDSTVATVAASAMPNVEEGQISDCDIQVGSRSVEAGQLAFTLMHEMGHCLGLGHNHSDYNAVMSYARSSYKLRLGADDKAGVIYLYPDGTTDSQPKELVACGTLRKTKGNRAALVLFLIPCFVWCVGRMRRLAV
ncbi:MAG: matrixin family metalloprotease [Oligoflexales bacterium]